MGSHLSHRFCFLENYFTYVHFPHPVIDRICILGLNSFEFLFAHQQLFDLLFEIYFMFLPQLVSPQILQKNTPFSAPIFHQIGTLSKIINEPMSTYYHQSPLFTLDFAFWVFKFFFYNYITSFSSFFLPRPPIYTSLVLFKCMFSVSVYINTTYLVYNSLLV